MTGKSEAANAAIARTWETLSVADRKQNSNQIQAAALAHFHSKEIKTFIFENPQPLD